MKKRYNILGLVWISIMVFFVSCDPNEDLYETMDEAKKPHSEAVEYTLTASDYSSIGGVVSDYEAFNDTISAMDYIPEILANRYVTLKLESSAMVTYNHLLLEPDWWEAGFGYELTLDDYDLIGISSYRFTWENMARSYLPTFLRGTIADPQEGDTQNVIYNYLAEDEDEVYLNLDTYEHDGSNWVWIETLENIPYAGYELTSEDYRSWGAGIGSYESFSEEYPPEDYLPSFLKSKFPLAKEGDEQVLKYNYFDAGQHTKIDKFEFDGVRWSMVPYIEERTEQYIYGELGWAFDPTVIFTMRSDDYAYLVEIDPIGQQEFQYDDFAYYYGASSFYSNFDIRLIGRRLDDLDDGGYADPELVEIYENEGSEAAMEEMLRRINEEGIPALLQHKYPDATPQVGGIDVHFIVRYHTFADNWVNRFPEAEYICTAAGNPPEFELIDVREQDE